MHVATSENPALAQIQCGRGNAHVRPVSNNTMRNQCNRHAANLQTYNAH